MICNCCGDNYPLEEYTECACCGGWTCPDCLQDRPEHGDQPVCQICREDLGYA